MNPAKTTEKNHQNHQNQQNQQQQQQGAKVSPKVPAFYSWCTPNGSHVSGGSPGSPGSDDVTPSAVPMSGQTQGHTGGGQEQQEVVLDAVLHAPAAERNKDHILQVVQRLLGKDNAGKKKASTGERASGSTFSKQVLEIASGTGQHICHFARALPNVFFQPSELTEQGRVSINIRASALAARAAGGQGGVGGLVNVGLAQRGEDLCSNPETWGGGGAEEEEAWPSQGKFDMVVATNLLHVSAKECVKGFALAASRALAAGGHCLLYGPFKVGGTATTPSNARFDVSLQRSNALWGLRDVEEVEEAMREKGMVAKARLEMPANNFMLVFQKEAGSKTIG